MTKKLLLAAAAIITVSFSTSCTQLPQGAKASDAKKMRVCLTTYSKYDDHWTRRGMTSTGMPLKCGATCAVDPKTIPYGSRVKIPDFGLDMKAVDTGSAVKSRKAARRRGEPQTPVVDIYFEKKSDARNFANSHPYFVDALVFDAKG